MIKNNQIMILGTGLSGMGSLKLANKMGINVFISDSKKISSETKKHFYKNDIEFEENGHNYSKLTESNEVIISPGISFRNLKKLYPEINKKKFISEIEFASRYTDAYIIAVTGSNGKTTTANLIYHILKSNGLNVGLAGNVGVSFASSVCDYSYDYYIIEISSFQLDHIVDFKPDISIITNISPDHLDRYNQNFESYVESKFRIIQNQTANDLFIYNNNCDATTNILNKINIQPNCISISIDKNKENKKQIFLNDHKINSSINKEKFMISINNIPLKGVHNLQNSMAAISVAQVLKISNEKIKESLKTFKNIPHRLEHFLTIQKVKYINDSKATNINAAFYALDSFKEPIVWIVGGIDKGNNYQDLIPKVKNNVKAIICLGKDNNKIIETFSKHTDLIVSTDDISEAVNSAYKISKPGDVVLLSPACASFDLFKNYEDRGNQFKDQVRKL